MKYSLRNRGSAFIFDIYEGGKRLGERVDIRGAKDEYKICLVCQEVAKGRTLKDLLNQDWSWNEVDFFNLLRRRSEWEGWFNFAKGIRDKMLIEEMIAKIRVSNLDDDKIENILKLLRGIQEAIRRNEGDSGIRSITYAQVYQPKAVVDRGWGIEE